MSSPIKLSNQYPIERTPPKSLRVNIPKELNSVEKRAYDLTKQFNQSISELASKPVYLPYDDTTPWDHHKALVRKGEEYSSYILEQNNKPLKEKQEAINEVNQRVKRAMAELDGIREEENKGLGRKIAEHNKEFGKKVKDLERSVSRQIEKMKTELMEGIRNAENESEVRIAERSKKLVEEVLPSSVRDPYGKPGRPLSAGCSPVKTNVNSPVKKMENTVAMKRLEESRDKVRELRAQYFSSTPGKEVSDVKRNGTGTGFYESRRSDSGEWSMGNS